MLTCLRRTGVVFWAVLFFMTFGRNAGPLSLAGVIANVAFATLKFYRFFLDGEFASRSRVGNGCPKCREEGKMKISMIAAIPW